MRFIKWKWTLAVLILAVLGIKSWIARSQQSPLYRFVVAGDRLFAIEGFDSYTTEQAVYTTNDNGDTWQAIDAPRQTYALAGDDRQLVAITSLNEIWRKGAEDKSWKLIKPSPAQNEYLYDVIVDAAGEIIVTSKDAVTIYDATGRIQQTYAIPVPHPDDELLLATRLVPGDDQHLIVEAKSNWVYVIDRPSHTIHRWADGLVVPPNSWGTMGKVRPYGDGFLMAQPTGIYQSDGLDQPWRLLTADIHFDDNLMCNFCRDLAGYDGGSGQWLVATNAGIDLMEGAKQLRRVYADQPGDHYLIMHVTRFHGFYFVSFARLAPNCMGIRLPHDLSEWKEVRLK